MSDFVLHAFLIPSHSDKPGSIIPMQTHYQFTSSAQPDGSTLVWLEEYDRQEKDVGGASLLPIDSVTVIYGINGGGKTQLLLDICNTLGHPDRKRPVGVLWEEHGQLYFDPGNCGLQVAFQGGRTVQTASLMAGQAVFGSIFYTTSPFEGARRRRWLSDSDTIDATPAFSANNPFGGVSLLRASGALPRELPFIRDAEIELSVHIPRFGELIEHYTGYRSRGGAPAEPRYVAVTAEQLDRLKTLPRNLDRRLLKSLIIEMEHARRQGEQVAKHLFLQILHAPDRSNVNSYIFELLLSRGGSHGTAGALDMVEALEVLQRRGGTAANGTRTFLGYVQDAQNWSEPTFHALQQAEALGVLSWSFQNLSSGQIAMLMLFASLANAIEKLAGRSGRCLVLTVDEGEMFMHPAWQRSYLSHLLSFLAFYRRRFDAIHLMLTTHSLIVAGDAPPKRLYDVVSGKMENGFAARPEELLDSIYNVKNFSGEYVDQLYARIGNYLREGGTSNEALDVRALVSQIASDRLRHYLEDEVNRRIGSMHAQAQNTPRR